MDHLYAGEDRFISRIGVGGLLNLSKMSAVQRVLEDIGFINEHCRQALRHAPWTEEKLRPAGGQPNGGDSPAKDLDSGAAPASPSRSGTLDDFCGQSQPGVLCFASLRAPDI